MIDAASRPCRPHRGVLCPIERLPWPRRWREGACGSPARRWTDPVALRLPRGCRRGLVSQVQRAPTWVGGTLPPTFKYNVDDSAPYHMESVLGLLDLNLPTDEGVYVPRDQQAGWKFDEALN